MTSSDKNFLTAKEFIKLAADFEGESAEYYRKMQNYELDESVRQLAELLEKQELSHKKILEKYELSEKEGYLQFSMEFSKSMPVLKNDNPSVEELILIALARETKSKEIYDNSAALANGKFKELLKGLANFEQEHISRLQSLKVNY